MHNNCLECTHPGRDCIPHLLTLQSTDLIAWCKGRKKKLGLSNVEIAARSNVPKGTIDRLFSSDTIDFRFSTIQPVICVLTGCAPADLDCVEPQPPVVQSPDPELLEKVHALQLQNHDLEKDLTYAEKTNTRLEDTIRSWKQAVYGMMCLCAVLAVSLVGYLRLDANNTDIGLIREDYTSPAALFPIVGIIAVGVAAVMLIRYKIKNRKENIEAT